PVPTTPFPYTTLFRSERVPPMGPIASARFLDSPRSRPLDAGAPMHDAPDVLVIGGGPAGSVAATLLADAGHRVLVLERERFPRLDRKSTRVNSSHDQI